METENINDASQSTEVKPTAEQTEIKNPDGVFAKNKELLGKNKALKEELDELRNFKMNQELAEKEQRGQHTEVISSLRQQLTEAKETSLNREKNFAFSQFQTQLKAKAQLEGCVNPDKLVRLMTKEQISKVEVDEHFTVNGDDLSRLVDELKEEHKDIGLFKNKGMKVDSVSGSMSQVMDSKSGKVELTKEETIARLKQLGK